MGEKHEWVWTEARDRWKYRCTKCGKWSRHRLEDPRWECRSETEGAGTPAKVKPMTPGKLTRAVEELTRRIEMLEGRVGGYGGWAEVNGKAEESVLVAP